MSSRGRVPRATLVAWLLVGLTPLLALVMLLAQRGAMDDQAEVAFEAAANLYQGGDPGLAQQAFAQLVQQGAGGVDLYYNWGAAALRAGDLITAVDALETAQRLAPRDEGVAAALETARAAQEAAGLAPVALPAVQQQQPSPVDKFVERLQGEWMSSQELALTALGLWIVFAALLLAALAPGSRPLRGRVRLLPLLAALPAGLLLAVWLLALMGLPG